MADITDIKPQTIAYDILRTLSFLKNIVKDEGNPLFIVTEPDFSTIQYPVLIGSRAAKWHVPSFREPNDWDLIATASQSILFIIKITANAIFNHIKLIHYSGVGLKIIGECIDYKDGNIINIEIELVSDKVDLEKMKPNEVVNLDSRMQKLRSDLNEFLRYINTYNGTNSSIIQKIGNLTHNVAKEFMLMNINEVNEFEFEKFNNDQEINQSKTSAQIILELCHDVEDKILFPLSGFPCIVAPLKILEALKASHIYWPTDFHKNIADLHSLRVILGYNKVSITQPLCNPIRDEQIELMLKARIRETEMIRGIPGKHINLNKTNEDFLDREDDLFVQRRVPHDELHERVKYGDHPIYENLKEDKSKAWIKKSLFQKIDYQTQLNCVREEAMVITLERYLIPMISKDQEISYRSALVRICTSLTKGWFREFAINNYPRISNLDKDLLSIAHNIIDNHHLPQKKQEDPSTLLYKWILDPESRAICEPIYLHTEIIPSFDDFGNYKPGNNRDFIANRIGIKITSPVNKDVSIMAVITTARLIDFEDCHPEAIWCVSIVIFPSEDLENLSDYSNEYYDPLHLHPFNHGYYETNEPCEILELTSKHIFTLEIHARSQGGSWGTGQDIWDSPDVYAKSADHIASKLEVPGFTGDLLFKYVLAYLQPTLQNNGNTPLKYKVDRFKAEGVIPVQPQQHLWYDAWNYTLKESEGRWYEKRY